MQYCDEVSLSSFAVESNSISHSSSVQQCQCQSLPLKRGCRGDHEYVVGPAVESHAALVKRPKNNKPLPPIDPSATYSVPITPHRFHDVFRDVFHQDVCGHKQQEVWRVRKTQRSWFLAVLWGQYRRVVLAFVGHQGGFGCYVFLHRRNRTPRGSWHGNWRRWRRYPPIDSQCSSCKFKETQVFFVQGCTDRAISSEAQSRLRPLTKANKVDSITTLSTNLDVREEELAELEASSSINSSFYQQKKTIMEKLDDVLAKK